MLGYPSKQIKCEDVSVSRICNNKVATIELDKIIGIGSKSKDIGDKQMEEKGHEHK